MRLRVNLSVLDDHYAEVATLPPVEAVYTPNHGRIPQEAMETAQKLLAEAIERMERTT